MISLRKKAIEWWSSLDLLYRDFLCRSYYHQDRKFNTLTGSEVEFIYEKEHAQINN